MSISFRAFGTHTVNLAWDPSTDSSVVGYKVYYGTNQAALTSSSSIDVGTNLSTSIANLGSGAYYFGATAYDSNHVESDLSNIASTNLVDPAVIVAQSGNVSCSYGTATNLTVTAGGSGPLNYQWYFNNTALSDGGNVSGATTSSLTFTSAVDANAGNYQVVVANGFGSATSAAMTLTVVHPPSIVSNPSSQTGNTGTSATFSVTADGASPLTYHWLKNGAAIADGNNVSGSTTAALTIASIATTDAGSYQCLVTNAWGAATSASGVLTVIVPAAITAQPSSQSASAGATATFSVTASGTAPLSFTWLKNGAALANGGNVAGATSANLTLSSVSASDAAKYSVVVANAGATVTSSSAGLTVINPPTITSQPASVTTNANSLVTLTIGANGSQLAFQWLKSGGAITNSANVSGATTASLTIDSAGAADADSYVCVVTNSAGAVTSSTATVTVIFPPAITSQPSSQSILAGTSAVFNVGATGTDPLTYVWTKNGAALADGGNVSGSATANLTITSASSSDAAGYSCTVSNSAGAATTATATLAVTNAVGSTVITSQPQNQNLNSCDTLVLSVVASSSTTPTYQWVHNGVSIAAATNSTFSVNGVAQADAGTYYVRVAGDSVVTSSNAIVTVADPVFVTQPADNCIAANSTYVFSAQACGTPNLSYQWYFAANGSTSASALSGQTNATLTIASATSQNAGQYFCIVTNSYNSITSHVASLGVEVPPTITSQPANLTVMTGNSATFAVGASASAPLTFQWTKNNKNISGATNSSYVIVSAQSTDAATYRCIVGTTLCQSTAETSASYGILTFSKDRTKPNSKLTSSSPQYTSAETTASGTPKNPAAQVYLSGIVSDNNGIADVTVSRTFPPTAPMTFHPALVGSAKASGWTNAVTLVPGTNTFTAVVTDVAGLASTNSINLFLRVPSVLHVNTTGAGSTAPLAPLTFGSPTNNATLDIGRNYRIQARPASGNVFSNWVDGSGTELSRNATLLFRMQTNLQLTANFVTNPIAANGAAGNYNGLFYETDEVRVQSAGAIFNLIVRPNATYGGTLKLDGGTYLFTGQFDVDGNSSKNITRAGKSIVTVKMHLDYAAKQISGTVSAAAPDQWTSVLMLDIAPYRAGNQFQNAAHYTLAVPPIDSTGTNSPGGYGYGFVTTTPSGMISFAGTLADGTQISQAVPISQDGYWPLFIPLYGNRGLIQGWLNFSGTGPSGNISWIRPGGNVTLSYTNGFTNVAQVFGSPYTAATPAFNPVDGALDIGIPAMTFPFAVSNNNAIVVLAGGPTNSLTGSISALNGAITVSYRPTDAAANQVAHGAVLQSNNGGYGFCMSNNVSVPLHLH